MLEKRQIEVGGLGVDVRSNFAQNRQSVLLVHGIGVSGRYFVPLAQVLAKSYAVYVLDLPGYGKTPKPSHALSISELAGVVADVTAFYNLRKPILIGQSMGCQTVVELARKKPRTYKKMILLGPTVNRKERHLFLQGLHLLQDTLREPLKLNCIIVTDYLRMGVGRYLRTSKFMLNYKTEKALSKCHIPTLIVRGSDDKIVPREWTQSLGAKAAKAEVKEIPGGPHNMQYTHPSELAKICRNFINT